MVVIDMIRVSFPCCTTYYALNIILAEENELVFLMAETAADESLLGVSKHCRQRHCMRAAAVEEEGTCSKLTYLTHA